MFKFSLQPVLEQRSIQEEKRQREFSETHQECEALKGRQRTMEQGIERRSQQVRELQRQGLRLAEREIYERWIDAQRQDLIRLDGERARLDARLAERRTRLVEAMRQRKMMEKLQEREYEAYRLEESRGERKLYDEIAVRDYSKQMKWEKDSRSEERIAR